MATAELTQLAPKSESDSAADENHRFKILRYEAIDVDDIEPHPENPRPTFHLKDDDKGLIALGDSIKTEGQHRPAVVYEMVGHYKEADRPGKYRLYQGERRWRACKIAGVKQLRCLVVTTPDSEASEFEWLGVEEAFKQEWQSFFHLKYCWELAQKLGVSVFNTEISNKTGVPMSDLKIAEKVFKLEPAIQYFAAEYEEMMYAQMTQGRRKRGGRLSGTGIRSKEFPVAKAAAVYDLFEAIRANMPAAINNKYTDLELQQLIAQKATQGATIDDLQKLHGQIRQLGNNPPPGLLAEIAELLSNENHTVKTLIKNTGVAESQKLQQFMTRAPKLRQVAAGIVEVIDQVGNDPDELDEVHREVLKAITDLSTLERHLSNKMMTMLRDRAR